MALKRYPHQHPEPKTHEFIVMAQYNNMIDNMVEEYVRNEIMKIVQIVKREYPKIGTLF